MIDQNTPRTSQTSAPEDTDRPDRTDAQSSTPDRPEPVTVFSSPHCQACAATKRSLDKAGVPFEAVDLGDLDPAEREQVVAGHTTAPIVHAPGIGTWSGHRPTQLDALIAQRRAASAPGAPGLAGPA
ncbi:glutaredoxin family protein [Cellulomonas sp. RIT-PI-Y]|uniref:glutaredoxin family protein n=1 Tax=Cellulomonas sp. RIT-PI-Y TaxID=3035297 RepID=UPI0021DB65FC|nr:glutaredoxin family protein [Cellulomonas sp. RIT-PI-Y]